MTTTVSRDDVIHLAQLSSLQLNDDQVASLQADIANILEYINQLSELDTNGIEPTYQVTDLENVMRDDVVKHHDAGRGKLLQLAPAQAEHQIKVPKVL